MRSLRSSLINKLLLMIIFVFVVSSISSVAFAEDIVLNWQMRVGDSPFTVDGTPEWATTSSSQTEQHWQPVGTPHLTRNDEFHFLWLRLRIPAGLTATHVLHIHAIDQAAEVYFKGQRIWSWGNMNPAGDTFSGWGPVNVPIPRHSAGEYLFVRVLSNHTNIGLIQPAVSSEKTIWAANYSRDMPVIAVISTILLIALIMIVVGLLNRGSPEFLASGLLCLSAALWQFSIDTYARLEIVENYRFWSQISIALLVPFAYFSLRWTRIVFGNGVLQTVRIFELASLLVLPIVAVAVAVDAPLISSLPYIQAFNIAGSLVIVLQVGHQLQRGNPEAKIFSIGFSLFILGCFARVLEALKIIPPINGLFPITLLLLVATFCTVVVRRVVLMYRDLREYSTTLKQKNDELTRLDNLKDQFLANTSHELRTPLNGIIGISESILDGAAGEVSNKIQQNLHLISQSGRRLANLLNDILDFSKLKSKNIELVLVPLRLHDVVEMVLATSMTMLDNKNIVLHNLVETNLPPVDADLNRLQQILFNILGNAIKFTSEGTINIRAMVENQRVLVTVTDTGIGISNDELERIFLSFEQADASTERTYGGTGLGLSITKKLVEMHGGEISVSSKPGVGSAFTFSLKLSESNEAIAVHRTTPFRSACTSLTQSRGGTLSHGENEPAATLGSRERVLVVDDEAVNRQVIKNTLRHHGYIVDEAADGFAALQEIKCNTPHLVLLDVMMPRMSGYDVCRKLRQSYPAEKLPIVLLTAKNEISNLIEGFDSGANDYLTKPFLTHELLARVNFQLDLSRSVNELMSLVEGIRTLSQCKDRREACLSAAKYLARLPIFAKNGFDLYFEVSEGPVYVNYHIPNSPSDKSATPTHGAALLQNHGSVSALPISADDICNQPFCKNGRLFVPVFTSERLVALFVTVESNDIGTQIDPRIANLLDALARFLGVILQTYAYFETISQQLTHENVRLEEKVGERTRDLERSKFELQQTLRQLEVSTGRLRSVLGAVKQGILVFDESLTILPEFSAAVCQIFETPTPVGQSLIPTCFTNTNLDNSSIAALEHVLQVILGEHEITYTLNRSILPREIVRRDQQDTPRQLELEWIPLVDKDIIARIMLIVRDVTEVRLLRASADSERNITEMIVEIIQSGIESFDLFGDEAMSILERWNRRTRALAPLANADIVQLAQDLHTLKGDARTLGLTRLAKVIHEQEAALKDGTAEQECSSRIVTILKSVAECLEVYLGIRDEKLTSSRDETNHRNKMLDEVLTEIVRWQKQPAQVPTPTKGVIHNLIRLRHPTVAEAIRSCEVLALRLAYERGVNQVRVSGGIDDDVILDTSAARALHAALHHFVRNSMTHAVDGTSQINITIEPRITAEGLSIVYRDSGLGLNLRMLRQKGIDAGVLHDSDRDSDLANLVFHPNLSTSTNVTEISGRGVGMGAARSLIRQKGGEVSLHLAANSQGDFVAFSILLTLPTSCLRSWQQLAEAS